MAEKLERTLSAMIPSEDDTLPLEYVRMQFCREFGYTPQQVDAMDAATFWLWLGFLKADARDPLPFRGQWVPATAGERTHGRH